MTVLTKPKTRTQKQTMYAIHKENFFYNGTYGAPADGLLTEDDGLIVPDNHRDDYDQDLILKFENKSAAEKYLTENNFEKWNEKEWVREGWYLLSHGEYDRPRYSIRKITV